MPTPTSFAFPTDRSARTQVALTVRQTLLALALVTGAAGAQTAGAPATPSTPATPATPASSAIPAIPASAAWDATIQEYHLPAGPLGRTLSGFAVDAGIALSFDPALTDGLASPALDGRHSRRDALARLLAGSGLEMVARSDGSYTLQKAVAPAAAANEASPRTLPDVRVTANPLGEVTEGSGSYAPGAIATATRLVLTPRETPQSISVVTRQEMDDFNINGINKVMEHTPGVSIVTYDSERTEYYARGFVIQNFQYDGIPMLGSSAYSAGHTLSDMAIYDRVEVIKGANGLLTGTLEHHFDNEWVAKLHLNHQINGYDAQLSAAAGGNPNPADGTGVMLWGPTWYDGKTKSDAIDLYATGPFTAWGRRHELVVGGSVYRRRWGSDTYLRQPGYDQRVPNYYAWAGDVPYPAWQHSQRFDETTRESGVYASTRLSLRDDTKLVLGGRVLSYEKGTVEESGAFVPYLGVVYDLTRNLSMYGSYTTIYQPQSRQTVEGSSLDPLEGRNREVGLKGTLLDNRLQFSTAYFQLDQNNYPEVVPGGRTPSGETAYRPTQGVRTKGYEIEASGRLAAGWQVHAGVSHKVSRQNGKKVATLTPENVVTLYASYKPGGQLGALTLGGGLRWQDKIWGAVTNLQDRTGPQIDAVARSFWLLDLSARYRINRNLSALFTVNNLLDKKYYTLFNWYSTYTWGEPRSANLSVTYTF